MEPELPRMTGSLKVNMRLVDSDAPALPCAGLYAVIVGATVSTVVNWYVLPDRPPNQLPAASLKLWFDIVTV